MDDVTLPLCVDERGCPQPGTCRLVLSCPRRGDKCPECFDRREILTEWSDRADADPELRALVVYYPEPPDGTVIIRCPRCRGGN